MEEVNRAIVNPCYASGAVLANNLFDIETRSLVAVTVIRSAERWKRDDRVEFGKRDRQDKGAQLRAEGRPTRAEFGDNRELPAGV